MSASAVDSYDYKLKIAIVGDYTVGRTCFEKRLTSGTFCPNTLATIGAAFNPKTIHIDGFHVMCEIWEINGHPAYHRLIPIYFQGTNGFIIVYDITSWSSFENLTFWMEQISNNQTVGQNVGKVIVGNKCDLEEKRAVDYETAKKFAEAADVPLFEVSAKSGVNVEQAFETLVATILKEKQHLQKQKPCNIQ